MFRLLIVDDNDSEVFLLIEVMQQLRHPHEVRGVGSGREALDYLYRRGTFTHAERPDLILLDINMPGLTGHDVLFAIKSHPELSLIPVIMHSSSTSPEDVLRSYQGHANGYVQKSIDLEGIKRVVGAIQAFWMDVAILPPATAATTGL